jgi:hypothetical protein
MKILGVDTGLTGACACVEVRADGPHVAAEVVMAAERSTKGGAP